ncbi:MAG: hypothetical protein J2O49_10645, partial [Sciscionella sp.]|nr:hypothetical protein [Sciscionella sp.]
MSGSSATGFGDRTVGLSGEAVDGSLGSSVVRSECASNDVFGCAATVFSVSDGEVSLAVSAAFAGGSLGSNRVVSLGCVVSFAVVSLGCVVSLAGVCSAGGCCRTVGPSSADDRDGVGIAAVESGAVESEAVAALVFEVSPFEVS